MTYPLFLGVWRKDMQIPGHSDSRWREIVRRAGRPAAEKLKIARFWGLRIAFFRIFDVVWESLIDYEQIMKDSHEIS